MFASLSARRTIRSSVDSSLFANGFWGSTIQLTPMQWALARNNLSAVISKARVTWAVVRKPPSRVIFRLKSILFSFPTQIGSSIASWWSFVGIKSSITTVSHGIVVPAGIRTLFVVSFVITKIGSLVIGWIIHLFIPFIKSEWIAAPLETWVWRSWGTRISESSKCFFNASCIKGFWALPPISNT